MKSNNSSRGKTKPNKTIVKSSNLGGLTKITDNLLVGRKVPDEELGQHRNSERKSILLIP